MSYGWVVFVVIINWIVGMCVGCATEYLCLKINRKSGKKVEPYLDYNGKTVWRCGGCGNVIFYPTGTDSDADNMNHYRFCSHCGKVIDWTNDPIITWI